MKLRRKFLSILLLAGWAVSVERAQAASPAAPATLAYSSTSADSMPVKIVEVRGDSATLARQYAAALAPAYQVLNEKYLGKVLADPLLRGLAGTLAMNYEAKLRPEHLAEIKSLAAALPAKESDVMLANCFLDLMPMVACSTVTLPADAAPDRVARFARNLDFDSFNVADKNSVVFLYHPEGRYAFAAIGWPGMIGAVSGMNEHGLCLSNMEVTRGPGLAVRGMPYTLLYRTILERCKTVDEAIQLLQDTPRQTANNLMLMDAGGQRAVVEINPEKNVVRRGQAQTALISTNHQRGQDADRPGLCARYDYLHDTTKNEYGKIGRTEVVSLLEHVQQGNLTMQSMIFEPANRVLYLAVGTLAADRKYSKIDLGAYFKASAK